eukprot:Skav209882  [mRNA]  locus=scaffold3263:59982:78052:+ [translate_table: standard]
MSDRTIDSFLRLPFFDDPFRSALSDLNLNRVEFWLAMSGDDDHPAEDQLAEMLPALSSDQDVIDQVLNRLGMVQILASVIARSSDEVQRQIATDLGYGSADVKQGGIKRPAPADGSVEDQPPVIGGMPGGRGPQGEITSIQAQENSERQKWGLRLQAIAARAGEAAAINDPSRAIGIPPAEALRLRTMGSKSKNTNGENLGTYIEEALAEQCKSKLAEKDEEVNRLMELLHDMEERFASKCISGDEKQQKLQKDLELERLQQNELQLQQNLDELQRLQRHSKAVEALAAERGSESERLKGELHQMRQEAEANATKLAQFREYQSKAFELKSTNDVLSEQLEALQEEMQKMQSDYNEEVEQLKQEISMSQNDRRTHRQAVEEHVEAKISQLRKEKNEELLEALSKQEEKKKKMKEVLKDLEADRDRLALKVHAQELELQQLQALHADGPGERVTALREQSQFAFDEMAKRLVEIREEGEAERKRLQGDLQQQLKQRAAALVEVQNDRDRAETHAEALEQSNRDLSQQRDELVRQLGEERKRTQDLQEELDLQHEHQKTQQQHHAVLALVHALQKSTVMPAFSLLRRSIGGAMSCKQSSGKEEQAEKVDVVEDLDANTSVGEEAGSEEEDSEEEEDSYGTDNSGQEEWAELMRANTFEACFFGADTVGQNTSRAATDLQAHVSNITTSLELFPQIYPSLLQELDRSSKGYGQVLRKFILLMQKATDRAVRIASKVVELCDQNADVIAKAKNLFRLKSLDGHLKSLRTAGQHEVLLCLYKNQLAAQKEAYEDVLDQYGAQCEQNTELEEKVNFLEKEQQELRNQLAGSKVSQTDSGEMEELRSQLEDAKKQILRLQESGENLDRATLQTSSAAAGAENAESAKEASPTVDDENPTPVPAKAKGKGKKGPGPPPGKGGVAAAAETAAENDESAKETPPTADDENPTPGPAKAKGKGKKGPGPPPGKGGVAAAAETAAENDESAKETPPTADDENPTPGPAKAKGKGKKGPGPPPGKGGGEQAQSEQTTSQDSVPLGKGKAPPKGGAKGKSKGGKSALPEINPGPAPPKDMVGKKFHWTNVTGNRFAGSMFESIVEALNSSAKAAEQDSDQPAEGASNTLRVKLDVGVLTNFFFKRKDEAEANTSEAKESKKKTVAQCLSMQRSQNIEIFLNGCGINISHVKSAVLDLDEKAMDADNLGKVIEILPQGEELQELMEFKKNNDPSVLPWGRAEDFLLQLLDVPNFKTRAECCLTKSKFDPVCKEILQDIELLHKCLSCVVDSVWLPNIFALVMQMGNYLNHGTNKGQQRGFTLDTLPLLTRVEGFQDKSYSLIRFLMDTLESDRKVKDGAMKDLELCESAAKLDFEESARRLNEIEKKVTSVEKSLQEIDDDSGAFKTPMEVFVTTAQERLSKLREKVKKEKAEKRKAEQQAKAKAPLMPCCGSADSASALVEASEAKRQSMKQQEPAPAQAPTLVTGERLVGSYCLGDALCLRDALEMP